MTPEEIFYSGSAKARLIRAALIPLTGLYTLGWQAYLAIYKVGFKKAAEPHPRVICVGNLVAGGSGKSPVTLHIAQVLQGLGYRVIIGCSGYGSPRAEAAQIAPEGPLDPTEWGDEPAMIRWLAPQFPLVVGRRRVLAAQLAFQHDPESVLLMDDGFQHLPLKKKICILLEDPNPKNRLCFPAGPYREPRWNLRRADLVLPEERFSVVYSATRFVRPDGSEAARPDRANLLCAIGQPDKLVQSLAALGIDLIHQNLRSDHDPLQDENLFAGIDPESPLLVTSKDWVKIQNRADLPPNTLILMREAKIEPPAFADWLQEKLKNHT